jgi:hypothetical protein
MNSQVSRSRIQALVFLPVILSVVVWQLQSLFEAERNDIRSPLSCACKRKILALALPRWRQLPGPTPVLAPELDPAAEAVDVGEAEAIVYEAEYLRSKALNLYSLEGLLTREHCRSW